MSTATTWTVIGLLIASLVAAAFFAWQLWLEREQARSAADHWHTRYLDAEDDVAVARARADANGLSWIDALDAADRANERAERARFILPELYGPRHAGWVELGDAPLADAVEQRTGVVVEFPRRGGGSA